MNYNTSVTDASISWNVTAPPGHVIVIKGKAFWTPTTNGTCNMYSKVYDGPNTLSSRLNQVCSGPYRELSLGRYVYVENKIGSVYPDLFYVSFTFTAVREKVCTLDQTFNLTANSSSVLTSPYFDMKIYPRNMNCSWRVNAPSGYFVKLDIESIVNCPNDSLKIYDDGDEIMELRCVSYDKKITEGEVVVIVFTSDDIMERRNFRGFTIRFTAIKRATECLPSNSKEQNENIAISDPVPGIITTPSSYPSLLCKWKMRAPPNHVINIYVDWLSVAEKCNVLEPFSIFDRMNYTEYRFLKSFLCDIGGKDKTSFDAVSSGSMAMIEFSGKNVTRLSQGFFANYTFVPLDVTKVGTCAANSSSGVVHMRSQAGTVRYPENALPSNSTCAWNITVEPGFYVEVFDVNPLKTCWAAPAKTPVFYDGTDGAVLFDSCNKLNLFGKFYTTGNSLYVNVSSPLSSVAKWEFRFSYRAVQMVPKTYACLYPVQSINASEGKVASPGYPGVYPNYAHCRWRFVPRFAKLMRLRIDSFDLPDSPNCTGDMVEFNRQPRLCGDMKLPKVIEGYHINTNYLEFKSDRSGQRRGFEASFYYVDDPSFGNCTMQGKENIIHLTGDSGSFFSPAYPSIFPKNMKCSWLITVPKGKKVKLKFSLQLSPQCNSYVEVRDGADYSTAKLLGKFCGYKDPAAVFSEGNQVWAKFVSHKTEYSGYNFHASYETVNFLPLKSACRVSSEYSRNTRKDSSSGEISSYEYPNKYENHVTCIWSISGSNWYRYKLTFESFDLEPSDNCVADFVEIRDGYSFKEVLGRFCGNKTIPEPVYTSGEFLWMKFKTNNSTRYGGFKAKYTSELSTLSKVLIILASSIAGLFLIGSVIFVFKDDIIEKWNSSRQRTQEIPEGASVAGSNFALTSRDK
ncbi:cubilin [Nematostella vectensis]|uniref:cubilin n=1 Tax=Nematostella vectensis TaxID=45351 RepID=UPI0020776F7C|nr:cubilin [Nematostella vectensis]